MNNFGQGKEQHRPMWPNYQQKKPTLRQLILLEKGTFYDERGTRLFRADSEQDLLAFIRSGEYATFTDNLRSPYNLELSYSVVMDTGVKVLCDKKGRPTLIRVQAGRESRWIVGGRNWGFEYIEPSDIRNLRKEVFEYYGLGFKPTISSLGQAHQRDVWFKDKLSYHTSPGLGCCNFIAENATGGMAQTPGKGIVYNESPCSYLDKFAAWPSQYVLHSTGTPIFFRGEPKRNEYFSFFAEVEIFIPYPLPLGVFPVRTRAKHGKRVVWPTEPGLYKNVYIWKSQYKNIIAAGCYVNFIRGYGWRQYTTDNLYWSSEAISKRKRAPSEFASNIVKRASNAAIGRNGTRGEFYLLVPEGRSRASDRPLLTEYGEPLNIFVREEKNYFEPIMPHWFYETITYCNDAVYEFALPYAKEGRLIQIDFDSVLVIEHDEGRRFVARKEMSSHNITPGQFLYMQLHNVECPEDRQMKSDELTKMPGVSKEIEL